MGTLEAHNGYWGAFTDVVYVNVSGNKSQSRDFSMGASGIPAGTSADLGLDIKGLVWTLAGEYRLGSNPASHVDLLVGARMFQLKERLDWSIYGNLGSIAATGRTASSEVSETVWDGIVGLKGRYAFGANGQWFVPYYVDVGAGNSKLTWQGTAGIGYSFRWGDLTAMWRYLDYDFKSGGKFEGITFNGPMVGAAFHR